jgi:hypothetical protein
MTPVFVLFGQFRSRFERAEMGRPVIKKLLGTGNGTVSRGSVQHLRVVFPERRELSAPGQG